MTWPGLRERSVQRCGALLQDRCRRLYRERPVARRSPSRETSTATRPPCWREFDRVVQQVQHESLEPVRVALHDHGIRVLTSHGDPSRLGHGLDLVDERRRERSEIDGANRERDLAGLCPGEDEDLVDQPLESVDFFKLAGRALLQVHVATLQHRHFDVAAERRQRRPKFVRKGGAELTHLADGVLEPFESVVERGGHIVQFVVCAPDRHPAAEVLDVDGPCRLGEPRERRQREARHPAPDHERGHESCRHACEEQKEKTFQRAIHWRERDAHLQQVALSVGWSQDAVRETESSVVGVHVQVETADRETGALRVD